jgi:hypothetical protein
MLQTIAINEFICENQDYAFYYIDDVPKSVNILNTKKCLFGDQL